ncbi:MAG: hypothetical protein WC854_13085 [Bacteroidales bacterium]
MSTIIDVKKAVVKFLKENINCYDVTVVKIEKEKEIWNSVAEVYEDDSFLKSMNMPPKQVRLFYSVRMDEKLEITSFERLSSFEKKDSTAE